jgi:trehalose/maltose hydrolase-like predicted phosphorylase
VNTDHPVTGWHWVYEGYEPAEEKLREALCTIGNGYLGSRAAAPESTAGDVHYPGTYVAGLFNRRTSQVAGRDVENECMVNLPNWLASTFRIDGGDWFDIDDTEILEYELALDIRRAVLTRRFRCRDHHGRTTAVTQRRLAHMQHQHVCALETTIRAEDWSGTLEVRSGIDGNVENTLVERYRDLESRHLELLRATEVADDAVVIEAMTNQSHVHVAVGARSTMRRAGEHGQVGRELVESEQWIGHDLRTEVDRGEAVTVDKIVTIFTSRDHAVTQPAEEAARWLARLGTFDDLLDSHVTAWRHLWDRFHVGVDDEQTMAITRLHLLHVLQTLSPNTADIDAGVPARGLHGEAYRGHIFWDEIFVLPILNLRLPALSRSLLIYRYRRLPEAREAARAAGFAGAMFPWQSGSDGREESQLLHLNPESGRWNPDATHRQRHIGIAIAYNVWQYFQVTDDREFLDHHGAEMLLDIARFFSSIADYEPSRDRYVIRNVVGPDEFHTGYPDDEEETGIDNNAYTNVMTVWVLQRALDSLDRLAPHDRDHLLETLGIEPSELDRWRDITEKMFVPFHDDGIVSQFEGYEDLEELDWDDYRKRYDDIQRLDRILEAENDSVNRYQVSKQADVLMLFYLLSCDELRELLERLGHQLEPDAVPRIIDYYLARTSHGSTLSAVVHSWVLTRARREGGVELFFRALRSDVVDIQGGTTHEGIHLAAMAGSVDLLQRCFAGVETRQDRLILNPYWPDELGLLEFTLRYREHLLTIQITDGEVRLSSAPGALTPIVVSCRDEETTLESGNSVTFPISHRDHPTKEKQP